MFLKNAHRIYWSNDPPKGALYGVTFQHEWQFNEIEMYSDYFRNLRIGESTNLSLIEYLKLDYDIAIDILNKEVKRAEKEAEEEKRRREEADRSRTQSKGLSNRLKR